MTPRTEQRIARVRAAMKSDRRAPSPIESAEARRPIALPATLLRQLQDGAARGSRTRLS